MLRQSYSCYIGGQARDLSEWLDVVDKYTGECVTRVALADRKHIEEAISAAFAAKAAMAALPSYARRDVLEHCVTRFGEHFEELAQVTCIETGKPIRDARGEVTRLIDTFRVAAEESTRIVGEVVPLDITPRARDYRGQWQRVPIGACSFISPFNFPLNLVAHKIAPSIAAGCPFVLKPASLTPVGALIIGEILSECDLPAGAFSILPCRRRDADAFTTDERLSLLSFTGSPDVGWQLKAKAGKKRVVLELGGNAAVVVDRDAPLDDTVERITIGAFYQSGQSCIGVQRILIHEDRYVEFRDALVARARRLVVGDPHDEQTFVGPMISDGEASRLARWISSAIEAGGALLCGGGRDGNVIEPAYLENVPANEPIVAEEAFGPAAVLSSFRDFDAAIAEVNCSRYGLQAGVFTDSLEHAMQAWNELEVGGVVIGDVPSWRVDHMPYGGVKDSGFGREGLRFAIEDMTEMRLLVMRKRPHA